MTEIRCPAAVATALRRAGWSGNSGWWHHPMHTGARRWWEAYCALRQAPRVRRCKRTADWLQEASA